ncbi:MAG TPA: peptide deformylase [Solirubrobacteraceae bacterium]
MAETDTDIETEPAQLDPEVAERRRAALAEVRQFGDPVLKAKARPIDVFDDELRAEVLRMGALMDDAIGIGLAATQVGKLHRLLVYRMSSQAPLCAIINPSVTWTSKEKEIYEEGCLSLPGVALDIERPIYATIEAQDEFGEHLTIEAAGLEARVLQHEIDHLDGVLILDRAPRDQRKEAMRTLRETLES